MLRTLPVAALLLGLLPAQTPAPKKPPAAVTSVPSPGVGDEWGSGKWLVRHVETTERHAQGGVDLVVLGDGSMADPVAQTALRELVAPLRTSFACERGDRTQHVLWRVEHGALEGLAPRWIALVVGAENLKGGDAETDVELGLQAVVDAVRRTQPHANLLVAVPALADSTPTTRAACEKLAERIRAKAFADHASTVPVPDASEVPQALARAIADLESTRVKHVVLVAGDEEYRSEESLPMLAQLAQRELGIRATVCLPRAADGTVDPQRLDHVDGLRVLDSADALVLFTRFRALPDDELRPLVAHAALGRAIVGFRTATHAFAYPADGPNAKYNAEWPRTTFGQRWIAHHGHFDDGEAPLTQVALVDAAKDHPILRGVAPFRAYSWLYHVDGGGDALNAVKDVLLQGTALRSKLADETRFPRTQPVAWTREDPRGGGEGRVFFTTLGHPFDFREESMRRLALHGLAWALGRPDAIPPAGLDVRVEPPFEPSNSGIGGHRRGVR